MDIKLPIPTYVINLPERTDRKQHIIEQFKDKPEFDLIFVDAVKDKDGAIGIWKSLVKVIKIAKEANHKKIIFCEDDHIFTYHYSSEYLLKSIKEAKEKGVVLLSGGISGFGLSVPIEKNLYWVDWYWGNQFLIIDAILYDRIINYDFKSGNTADETLSWLTNSKATMYPFISEQKEFGYSDISSINGRKGYVSWLFNNARKRLLSIHRVNEIYNDYT